MGDISFYQMTYFVFVTISTVGYGDYSPVTVIGRFLIIFVIMGGVVFFSNQTAYVAHTTHTFPSRGYLNP